MPLSSELRRFRAGAASKTGVDVERVMYLGVDLGQSPDPTALAAVERVISIFWDQVDPATREPLVSVSYDLRHLERVALGTAYPIVCDRVRAVRDRLVELVPASPLQEVIVDGTGVGAPVIDFLRTGWNSPARLVCIKIHGGDQVGHGADMLSVPKRDLIGALLVLYQAGLFRVPASLAEARNLEGELVAYRVKYSKEGHDSYNPQRSTQHDDEVLACALCAYRARIDLRRREQGRRVSALRFS